MKTTHLTFYLFLFLTCIGVYAQDTISVINSKCVLTNKNIKSYKKKTKEDCTQSTDCGTVTGYYKGKELDYIFAEYFGETGKLQEHFYLYKGVLILSIFKDFEYNRPYYWDQKTAKENGDSEYFDVKKTKLTIDTLYFNNNTLIRWVKNKNTLNNAETNLYLKKEKETFNEIQRITTLLK